MSRSIVCFALALRCGADRPCLAGTPGTGLPWRRAGFGKPGRGRRRRSRCPGDELGHRPRLRWAVLRQRPGGLDEGVHPWCWSGASAARIIIEHARAAAALVAGRTTGHLAASADRRRWCGGRRRRRRRRQRRRGFAGRLVRPADALAVPVTKRAQTRARRVRMASSRPREKSFVGATTPAAYLWRVDEETWAGRPAGAAPGLVGTGGRGAIDSSPRTPWPKAFPARHRDARRPGIRRAE